MALDLRETDTGRIQEKDTEELKASKDNCKKIANCKLRKQ